MIPKFRITLQNHKFGSYDLDKLMDYCNTLKDGEYFLTIKSATEKEIRSNNQNKYYWGCVLKLLSEETGYSVEDMHELMKSKFLSKWLVVRGLTYKIVCSTTDLKTNKMEEYLRQIREFASIDLGCYIPNPNEVVYE
jgi:hypothetical protein